MASTPGAPAVATALVPVGAVLPTISAASSQPVGSEPCATAKSGRLCPHANCLLHALTGWRNGFATGYTLRSAFTLAISLFSPRLWGKEGGQVLVVCFLCVHILGHARRVVGRATVCVGIFSLVFSSSFLLRVWIRC